ncbi:hypothetical protein ACF1GT_02170 [Streptomyces sp. NPDC014636]|uniref:hypothetical protein n=1 Tax=Streptomyces sp. NPDC014636 TaxID=3364876 RepID=UPI0036FE2F0F
MPKRRTPVADHHSRPIDAEHAEAALLEHYVRLSGLAHAGRAGVMNGGEPEDRPPGPVPSPAPDPCLPHVRPTDLPHVRPTDLLRRGHRLRAVAAVLALAAATGAALLTLPSDAGRRGAAPRPAAGAGAQHLGQAAADAWTHTARLDFAVWPARGRRTGDTALLARALRAWTDPAGRGRRSVEPGDPVGGPGTRLLFADDVDGRAVVLLQDGIHTVRYSEPPHGGKAELAVALTQDADVTTAAVVVSRSPRSVRLLLAPWIATAAVRDLRAPSAGTHAVTRDRNGVTEPVAVTAAGSVTAADGPCRGVPVVQLRSSPRIAEERAFLLADLGGLVPAHLTYMPAPRPGTLPRPPREATGEAGLRGWAASACRLAGLHGQGVRSVDHWVFATQPLPERSGNATWVCARAETWRGTGDVEYLFLAPGGTPARVVGRGRDTAQCSRFGQHVLAHTEWRAPSGTAYLLVAGSRAVTRLDVTAPVRSTADGRWLAVRAPSGRPVEVTGRLPDGTRIGSPLSPDGP